MKNVKKILMNGADKKYYAHAVEILSPEGIEFDCFAPTSRLKMDALSA